MVRYEEDRLVSPFWGWMIIVGVSMFIFGYGMMLHVLIREGPRHWEFYSVPITPGESEYSTLTPPPTATPPPVPLPQHVRAAAPRQIEPLPPGMRFVAPSQRPVPGPQAAVEGATP